MDARECERMRRKKECEGEMSGLARSLRMWRWSVCGLLWLWLEVVVAVVSAWCHLRIPVAYIQSLTCIHFLTNSITHTPVRPSFLSIFYLTRRALNIMPRNEISEQKTLQEMTGYTAIN